MLVKIKLYVEDTDWNWLVNTVKDDVLGDTASRLVRQMISVYRAARDDVVNSHKASMQNQTFMDMVNLQLSCNVAAERAKQARYGDLIVKKMLTENQRTGVNVAPDDE